MNIESIVTGTYEAVCYLVWDTNRKTIVFDPGHDAPLLFHALERNKLEVVAYVCTHGHADHINALADLHAKYPAPIAIHSNDLTWAFDSINCVEPHYPVPKRPDIEMFQSLENSKDWNFGNLHFQCLETPGHTPGSCCLLFLESGILIAGDTLFKGSCGRTDLPGGNARQMKESLNMLKQLPDDILVYPGHGPESTIGYERRTNFFMK